MQKKIVHVVAADDGWAVEVEGRLDRTVYPSQIAAIAAGWERAKRDQAALFLYDRNGEVWARDTFDNDSSSER